MGNPCSLGWRVSGAEAARYSGRTPTQSDRHAVQHRGTFPAAGQATFPVEQRAETQELYQAPDAAAQREIAGARRRCRGSSNSPRKEFANKVLARSGAFAPGPGSAPERRWPAPLTVAGAPPPSLL